MQADTLIESGCRFISNLSSFDTKMRTECSPYIANKPFINIYQEEIPFQGLSQKSGAYIFSDLDLKVLYIGKAGANNFAAEIWNKFSAIDLSSGRFENSTMAKYAGDEHKKYGDLIKRGEVLIHAIVVEPKELSSLVEVFLQTYFVRLTKELPPLNKRIG